VPVVACLRQVKGDAPSLFDLWVPDAQSGEIHRMLTRSNVL